MHEYAFAGPTTERRDALRSAGVAVLVTLLSLAAATVFIAGSSTRSWFPSRWDAHVEPIAATHG